MSRTEDVRAAPQYPVDGPMTPELWRIVHHHVSLDWWPGRHSVVIWPNDPPGPSVDKIEGTARFQADAMAAAVDWLYRRGWQKVSRWERFGGGWRAYLIKTARLPGESGPREG